MGARQLEQIETVMTYEEWEIIHNRKIEKRKARAKKKIQQKLMGIAMVAISILIPIVCDGDATASVITLPMGAWLLATKGIVIY